MTEREKHEHKEMPRRRDPRVTPREAEVLDLASAGLSDREIASRLHLSERAVRFQFEKIYDRFDVRDRSRAITVWSSAAPRSWKTDRCPYPKPFADGFADCPAYRAMRVADLDLKNRLTGALWTCSNLESRLNPQTEDRWYSACALGRAPDRERWAAEVAGSDRLRELNRLAQEMAAITEPAVERLWRLKRIQAREIEAGRDGAAATRDLQRLRDQVLARLAGLLRDRRDTLDRHGLSESSCLDVGRRALDGLVPARVSGDWNFRLDVLLALPVEAWPTHA